VNAQLISYYFGGKEGLYEELVNRWQARERSLEQQGLSFPDLAVAYLQVGFEQPGLMRMFIWENLTRTRRSAVSDSGEYEEPPEIADLRRRQANGEIDDDIDVACLLVAVQGAVSAPTTMPQEVERLCGMTVDSDEFQKRYAEQMRIILRHLAAPSDRSGGKKTRDLP
jgi:AcrR family transcriptional regulator